MTTPRTLPDGSTITYTSAGRLWERPDGKLLSVNYGPWEPVQILFWDVQQGPDCRLAHPGAECAQPDLFGGAL